MSPEDELVELARHREAATEDALLGMILDAPHSLRRQVREYLRRQVDYRRIKRPDEGIPQLETIPGGINELTCPSVDFLSDARLDFKIQFEENQRGWFVKQFQFHVPAPRSIRMVRIHLNAATVRDPLAVPRCHMHVDGKAHVPFPIMNPRLILYLICEHIEPDFGVRKSPAAQ